MARPDNLVFQAPASRIRLGLWPVHFLSQMRSPCPLRGVCLPVDLPGWQQLPEADNLQVPKNVPPSIHLFPFSMLLYHEGSFVKSSQLLRFEATWSPSLDIRS